jgi:hypothetical protein
MWRSVVVVVMVVALRLWVVLWEKEEEKTRGFGRRSSQQIEEMGWI